MSLCHVVNYTYYVFFELLFKWKIQRLIMYIGDSSDILTKKVFSFLGFRTCNSHVIGLIRNLLYYAINWQTTCYSLHDRNCTNLILVEKTKTKVFIWEVI